MKAGKVFVAAILIVAMIAIGVYGVLPAKPYTATNIPVETSPEWDIVSAHGYGDKLVYEVRNPSTDEHQIRLFDIPTQQTTMIVNSTPSYVYQHPRISGSNLIFLRYPKPITLLSGDIMHYNMTSGVTTTLISSSHGEGIVDVDISNGWVAYTRERFEYPIHNSPDVLMFNISNPNSALTQCNYEGGSSYQATDPMIDDKTVFFWNYSANKGELYYLPTDTRTTMSDCQGSYMGGMNSGSIWGIGIFQSSGFSVWEYQSGVAASPGKVVSNTASVPSTDYWDEDYQIGAYIRGAPRDDLWIYDRVNQNYMMLYDGDGAANTAPINCGVIPSTTQNDYAEYIYYSKENGSPGKTDLWIARWNYKPGTDVSQLYSPGIETQVRPPVNEPQAVLIIITMIGFAAAAIGLLLASRANVIGGAGRGLQAIPPPYRSRMATIQNTRQEPMFHVKISYGSKYTGRQKRRRRG